MIGGLVGQRVRRRGRPGIVPAGAPGSEPFRTLRLALQLRGDARGEAAILITSAEPRAGKSTVAANYALVSSLGQRVLLIDADFRSPSVHEIFGLRRSPGLVELLADDGELDDYVSDVPGLGQLDVLPSGRGIPRSGDLASSPRMAEIIRVAVERYDTVVIDSPPVLSVADTEGLACHPGVDVIVVANRSTKRRVLRKALRKLELVEAHVLGIVVNELGRARSYGYGS